MKASRLLSILMLLQARKRMTTPALAQLLEVSERTILRDIDQLSAAGVPVWSERGRNGGFQLRAGWSTELTGLTEAEVSGLFLAGLPDAATELGLGAAAASARLKIIAGLPAQWRDQAASVAERLHIDPVDWYRVAETPARLREVATAVWSARRIRVHYQSWDKLSERQLDPLGLVLKAGAWYLVARSSGSRRMATYRLANVQHLIVDEQTFERPPRFALAQYWTDSIARFEADLQRIQVHARVSARGANWLANARLKTVPCTPANGAADGWRDVLIAVESIEHGARQLLAFGTEIEILEPLELREKVAAIARAVANAHSGPG